MLAAVAFAAPPLFVAACGATSYPSSPPAGWANGGSEDGSTSSPSSTADAGSSGSGDDGSSLPSADAGGGGGGDACVPSTADGIGSNDAGYGCGDSGIAGLCDNGIRQTPPTCNPTVDALVQRTPLACASKNSTHSYNLDSDPNDPDSLAHRTADMCNLKGAIYWVADMDIDCDGRTTSVCPGTGANMDPSYQNDTFVHTNAGSAFHGGAGVPLASSLDEYVVIPSDNYKGVTPGAVVAVIYGTKMTYAVFGDTGPVKIIGEGSVALANALGIPPSPANGGVLGNTVTFIAFTGAAAVPGDIENRGQIEALGQTLTQQLLADNPVVDAGDGG